MPAMHQYIDRRDGRVVDESLVGNRVLSLLYSRGREHMPRLFDALTSHRMSRLLSMVNFDLPLAPRFLGVKRQMFARGIRFDECLDAPDNLNTLRRLFERKIRYWRYRPMPSDPATVVCPADARVIVGSLRNGSLLFLKEKFFAFKELLGDSNAGWQTAFDGGDYAIFRLTPEKYHYNHAPVTGRVEAIYEIGGAYHACNPNAVVEMVTSYSKNRRVVTVIQTDVPGGTGVGRVAMVEVVALMIGDILQCYSARNYDAPVPVAPDMLLEKGQPKSLFRPGSSTTVLLFEPGRVRFADDLIRNMRRQDVASRFTAAFHKPLVETDVEVRSLLGRRRA